MLLQHFQPAGFIVPPVPAGRRLLSRRPELFLRRLQLQANPVVLLPAVLNPLQFGQQRFPARYFRNLYSGLGLLAADGFQFPLQQGQRFLGLFPLIRRGGGFCAETPGIGQRLHPRCALDAHFFQPRFLLRPFGQLRFPRLERFPFPGCRFTTDSRRLQQHLRFLPMGCCFLLLAFSFLRHGDHFTDCSSLERPA